MVSIRLAQAGDLLLMGNQPGGQRLSLLKRSYGLVHATLAMSDAAFSAFETESAEAPFAMGGVLALPEGVAETWFLVRPGGLPAHLLTGVLHFGKRLYAACPMPVICCVRVDNPAGQRLARLLGFLETERRHGAAGEWQEWQRPWGKSSKDYSAAATVG